MKNISTPQIALTKDERNALLNLVKNPVCNVVNCGGTVCEDCPFNEVTDMINDAFLKVRLIAEKLPTYEESE